MKTSNFIQTRICDDNQEINSIWFPGEEDNGWSTESRSSFACEKIVAYMENGPHGQMAFYAVYKDGHVHARVPAYMVHIYYKKAP